EGRLGRRRARDRRDISPRAGLRGGAQGATRRHSALAPGAPAARPALGRQRLPQSVRRSLGRRAGRPARPQGKDGRRRHGQREARQLHRQRPAGHGGGRPPAWRARPARGPRETGRGAGVRDRVRRRLDRVAPRRGLRVSAADDARRAPIAVLFGGPSAEHDVSIVSGNAIADALETADQPVQRILIDLAGGWWWLPAGHRRDGRAPAVYDDPAALGAQGPISAGVATDLLRAPQPQPIVFVALHGPFGEDGTIQGMLQAAGLAYTGAGVTSRSRWWATILRGSSCTGRARSSPATSSTTTRPSTRPACPRQARAPRCPSGPEPWSTRSPGTPIAGAGPRVSRASTSSRAATR